MRKPVAKQALFHSPEPQGEPEIVEEVPSVPHVSLVEEEEGTSVELFWKAPLDGGSQIHEYKVKALELATQNLGVQLNRTNRPKFRYENLNPGHQYRFAVAAVRGSILSA